MNFQPLSNEDWSSPSSLRVDRHVILSVDDESRVLSSRYQLLSAAGYAVLSAIDGAQALDIFGNNPVDLVLLDYVLEGVDGGVVAEAMKTHSPHIPIVMVSGIELPEHCMATVNGYAARETVQRRCWNRFDGYCHPPGDLKSPHVNLSHQAAPAGVDQILAAPRNPTPLSTEGVRLTFFRPD